MRGKFFYDNYNADGLSGSPVIVVPNGTSSPIYHVKGIHTGTLLDTRYRYGQKIGPKIIKKMMERVTSVCHVEGK